jgi:hypothetical protein
MFLVGKHVLGAMQWGVRKMKRGAKSIQQLKLLQYMPGWPRCWDGSYPQMKKTASR